MLLRASSLLHLDHELDALALDYDPPRLNLEDAECDARIIPGCATRDDVARTKPHPDVYLEAARRLGVAPERCIAFEDSNVGLEAAHAAGTMAFMVPDLVKPLPESHARCLQVVPDLHTLLRLLREHL